MDIINIINGQNPQKENVLNLVGLKEQDVQRFRDCGYDYNKRVLWILARTGTNNVVGKSNKQLESKANYIGQADDTFDSTYEFIYFKLPALANLYGIEDYPIINIKKVENDFGKKDLSDEEMESMAKKIEVKTLFDSKNFQVISTINEN